MKKENKNKIKNHPELVSGSPTYLFNKENTFMDNNREAGDPECPQGGHHFITATKAFTLIELLVVVLIIGILAAIALPQYQKAVAKARVARLLPLMNSIEKAQVVYKMANGEYSDDLTALDIQMPGGQKASSTQTKAEYEDFWCTLGNTNTTKDSLYCGDRHYHFNLERYYRKYTICWFPKTDNVSKSLCGSLCQTSTFSQDTTGSQGKCTLK